MEPPPPPITAIIPPKLPRSNVFRPAVSVPVKVIRKVNAICLTLLSVALHHVYMIRGVTRHMLPHLHVNRPQVCGQDCWVLAKLLFCFVFCFCFFFFFIVGVDKNTKRTMQPSWPNRLGLSRTYYVAKKRIFYWGTNSGNVEPAQLVSQLVHGFLFIFPFADSAV